MLSRDARTMGPRSRRSLLSESMKSDGTGMSYFPVFPCSSLLSHLVLSCTLTSHHE